MEKFKKPYGSSPSTSELAYITAQPLVRDYMCSDMAGRCGLVKRK